MERIIFCVYLERDLNVYSKKMHLYFPAEDSKDAVQWKTIIKKQLMEQQIIIAKWHHDFQSINNFSLSYRVAQCLCVAGSNLLPELNKRLLKGAL